MKAAPNELTQDAALDLTCFEKHRSKPCAFWWESIINNNFQKVKFGLIKNAI